MIASMAAVVARGCLFILARGLIHWCFWSWQCSGDHQFQGLPRSPPPLPAHLLNPSLLPFIFPPDFEPGLGSPAENLSS